MRFHAQQNRKSGLLDVVSVLDTVDGGGPVHAQSLHLFELHDWIRSVEPPVSDERKEEESSLAKLEWLVVSIHVADTTDEGGFCRIEMTTVSLSKGENRENGGKFLYVVGPRCSRPRFETTFCFTSADPCVVPTSVICFFQCVKGPLKIYYIIQQSLTKRSYLRLSGALFHIASGFHQLRRWVSKEAYEISY